MMQKIIILICLVCLCSFIQANEELTKLKANHDIMIQKMGDIEFLNGTHYFAYFKNVPTSVYTIPKQKCIYAEYNDRKIYRIIIANEGNSKLDLSFSDKIALGETIYSLNYSISFIVSDRSGGYFVTLDKDNSIIESRIDWGKILACVLKYGEEVYQAVKSCIQSPNLMECLKIIGPAVDIYQCISASTLGMEPQYSGRALTYQTIYFEWSWGYSTGFKAPPIYKEMPYPILNFDSVTISTASNAWGIQVQGTTTGNNVAQVSLTNVSYMAYPTFWSSRVSGTIRCVMQK
jgi:hypothetical protein